MVDVVMLKTSQLFFWCRITHRLAIMRSYTATTKEWIQRECLLAFCEDKPLNQRTLRRIGGGKLFFIMFFIVFDATNIIWKKIIVKSFANNSSLFLNKYPELSICISVVIRICLSVFRYWGLHLPWAIPTKTRFVSAWLFLAAKRECEEKWVPFFWLQ